MPKFYCDYCDTYLTHNTPRFDLKPFSYIGMIHSKSPGPNIYLKMSYFASSVRKTHCAGRKHKENVKFYYQKWMEDQVSFFWLTASLEIVF